MCYLEKESLSCFSFQSRRTIRTLRRTLSFRSLFVSRATACAFSTSDISHNIIFNVKACSLLSRECKAQLSRVDEVNFSILSLLSLLLSLTSTTSVKTAE